MTNINHGSYKIDVKLPKNWEDGNRSRHKYLLCMYLLRKVEKPFFSGICWRNHQICVWHWRSLVKIEFRWFLMLIDSNWPIKLARNYSNKCYYLKCSKEINLALKTTNYGFLQKIAWKKVLKNHFWLLYLTQKQGQVAKCSQFFYLFIKSCRNREIKLKILWIMFTSVVTFHKWIEMGLNFSQECDKSTQGS